MFVSESVFETLEQEFCISRVIRYNRRAKFIPYTDRTVISNEVFHLARYDALCTVLTLQLLTPNDLTRTAIETLFARADEIVKGAPANVQHKRVALAMQYAPVPFPISVEATLRDAGADLVPIAPAQKPDDLAQNIRAANAQLVLFSHPQNASAHTLAAQINRTLLNAGDGTRENPVRALMDAYAIYTLRGALQTLRVGLLGNLKFAAEAHSLARVLGMFESRLSFITPAALSMPYDLTDEVRLTAYEVEETNDLATTLRKTDALVLFNIDAQRVEKKIYDKLKTFYTLTPETFAEAKEGLVILGNWDGAETLLAPARPHVERAARAMLLALCEE
jgi:aspartate carbamoyltransferase catalytic subunit